MSARALEAVFSALLSAATVTPSAIGSMAEEPLAAALSPDGKTLVREHRQGDAVLLTRVDVRTGAAEILVSLPGENRRPVWSPDGLFVAFCARFRGRYFVTVADMTGHSWMVQEIQGGFTAINWSPDAAWLVFSSQVTPEQRDIFIATAGGTHSRNITRSPGRSETTPIWTGDGKHIAYRYTDRRTGESRDARLPIQP